MRKQQKQISFLLLFSLFMLLLHPLVTEAEGEKGKLKIKTDRIMKDNQLNEYFGETELDKVFPDLFTEKVNEKITAKQQRSKNQTSTLKKIVLAEDITEETGLSEVKSSLFTDDYATTFRQQSPIDEEEQSFTSTVLFYASIGLIISVIVAVIYTMIRKFKTEG